MSEGALKRCGVVALIGAPNAGKSTLLNRLVGSKVAIVTHKVQTTRARLRGIVIEGDTQIIFVDTPGIFKPRRRLDKAMVEAAWSGAQDADAVVLIVDAQRGRDEEVERILAGLSVTRGKTVLALNKIDAVPRPGLLDLAAALNAGDIFERVFMISALNGDGVDDLRRYLAERMPASPWLYPADQVADVPMRMLASEITREKLYLRVHQELPYSLTVETEDWQDRKDGSVRIEQVIFVARESQRKIILGKGGQGIKAVGQQAREELAGLLGRPVHLFLRVKVREKWMDERERYAHIGLDFPSDRR